MSRCDIKINMEGWNKEQRIKHWNNVLVNGYCPDCDMGEKSSDDKYANISADNEEIYDKELLAVEQSL